jgi:hypothetical protein
MSTEATGPDVAAAPNASAAGAVLPPELLAMLAKAGNGAGGGAASFKQLLSMMQLTVEQHTLVDLFLSMDEGQADEDDDEADAPVSPRRGLASHAVGAADDDDPGDARLLHELTQELEDLREVNDTVAAALGACRACWGGDPGCPRCGGRGKAGFAAPDSALFQELVIPAVRRVRNHEREGGRAGFSRARPDTNTHWRQIDER